MTPEQQQLNNNLPQTPEFQNVKQEVGDLKTGQDKIIKMIEDNERETRAEFDKGSQMFKDLYGKVEAMEMQISEGFNKLSKELGDYKTEIKDEKITNLTKKIEQREVLKNGIIVTLIGGILLYLAVEVLKNINVNPPSEKRLEKLQRD